MVGYDTLSYSSGESVPAKGWSSASTEPMCASTILLNGSSTYTAATPVLESYTQFEGQSTGSTFDVPTGTSAGDLLVFTATANIISSSNMPSGWISVIEESSSRDTVVWYKVAGSSEPATYAFTGTVGVANGTVMRISGADTAGTPIGDSQVSSVLNVFNADYPAVTTPANSMIIRVCGVDDDINTNTWRDNYRLRPNGESLPATYSGVVDTSQHVVIDNVTKQATTPAASEFITTNDDLTMVSVVVLSGSSSPPSTPTGLGDENRWCPSSMTVPTTLGHGNNGTYQGGRHSYRHRQRWVACLQHVNHLYIEERASTTLNSVLSDSSTFTCWFKYTSPLASGGSGDHFIGPLTMESGWTGMVLSELKGLGLAGRSLPMRMTEQTMVVLDSLTLLARMEVGII